MHHMNTPHTSKVRVTVPVSAEVLALFQRLSQASGKSVGRLMGEWLDETRESLEPMIEIMSTFKTAPKAAVEALQLHANALTELSAGVIRDVMALDEKGVPKRAVSGSASDAGGPVRDSVYSIATGGLTPPSSNTGGKGRKTPKKSAGGSK